MVFNTTELLNQTNQGLLVYKYFNPGADFNPETGVYVKSKVTKSKQLSVHIYFWEGKWFFKDQLSQDHKGDMFNYVALNCKLHIQRDFKKILVEINRIIAKVKDDRKPKIDIGMNNAPIVYGNDSIRLYSKELTEQYLTKYMPFTDRTSSEVASSFKIDLVSEYSLGNSIGTYDINKNEILLSFQSLYDENHRLLYDPITHAVQNWGRSRNGLFGWEQSNLLVNFQYPVCKDNLIIVNTPELAIFINSVAIPSVAILGNDENSWDYLEHIILPQFKNIKSLFDLSVPSAINEYLRLKNDLKVTTLDNESELFITDLREIIEDSYLKEELIVNVLEATPGDIYLERFIN